MAAHTSQFFTNISIRINFNALKGEKLSQIQFISFASTIVLRHSHHILSFAAEILSDLLLASLLQPPLSMSHYNPISEIIYI